MVTIRRAREDELDFVNLLYRRADFVASDADDIVLIAEVACERVGVGRLVPVGDDAVELGGMYVVDAHRGGGLGRAIVARLVLEAGARAIWCIPYTHVAGLYRSFGMVDAVPGEPEPPPAVAEKLRFCRARYATSVVLLHRAAQT